MSRNRWVYLVGTIAVVALGLASRRYADSLPSFVASNAGDTLWAVMIFGIIAGLAHRWSTTRVAVTTLCGSSGVEISQLYHAQEVI